MIARVVINQIQPEKMDEWFVLIRDSIVPALKEQDGFSGFVALIDRDNDRSIGYSMWDSAEALAASEVSGNYREQIAKLGAVLAGSPDRQTYEVVVVA